MAQRTGKKGKQTTMAEDETFDDLQQILHPAVRQSASLPAMSSQVPAPLPAAQRRPHIRILEEPTNRIIRFRYKCEGRTAGSIAGMNTQPNAKTHPTIMICDYDGPVDIIVSCITHKTPYAQHPHHLVSKEEDKNCIAGIYQNSLPANERRFELKKVGIQCVKKSEVRDSLLERQKINVDPFHAGFRHMDNPSEINLYQLRLCYQAFIKVGHSKVPLDPVVSSPIYGKSNELTINRLCSCSSKMSGGDEIILLCEKVNKSDIKIRFFETNDEGNVVWEDFGIFQNQDVYKQMAIAFKTPRYHNPEIQHSVQVELQLVRPSDGATSDSHQFEYYPNPDTMSQRYRENARKFTESIKRKLPGNLHQNFKQSRILPRETLAVPQVKSPTVHISTYQDNRKSPTDTYGQQIKYEQTIFEMDSTRNCPSAASSTNCINYPLSPSSSYSNADSYAPVTTLQMQQQQQLQQQHQLLHIQQQQLQQQQQQQSQLPAQTCLSEQELMKSLDHLTMTDNTFFNPINDSTYPQLNNITSFNGGSLTPTNLHNNNINNMNNNINNIFSTNMSATSPSYNATNNYLPPYEQIAQPQPQCQIQTQQQTQAAPSQTLSDLLCDILTDGNVIESSNIEANIIIRDLQDTLDKLSKK